MDTKVLSFEKRMLEERIALAINEIRNSFRDATGIDIKLIEVKFMELEIGNGEKRQILDKVTSELAI